MALRGNRLVGRDGDEVRWTLPVARVRMVVACGEPTISGPAMATLMRRGVPVTWLNRTGRALARVSPAATSTGADRIRQFAASRDDLARVDLAQRFVAAKIRNQRTLLARRCRRAGLARPGAVTTLERTAEACGSATRVPEILGLEGAAAAAYYRTLRVLVPAQLGFPGRNRASADVVNQTTNYASALLREHVLVPVISAGLDPGISFLHQSDPSRPTLVFDLMEEWRAPLVDSVGLTLSARGELGADDLGPDGRLPLEARRRVVARFDERLDQRVTGDDGVARTYRDHLSVQVGRLVDHLRGRRPYQGFAWR
jgi:CRISPR-associated protein Cas1